MSGGGSKFQSGSIKANEVKRRTVFKPVLDNPYVKAEWPKIGQEDGNTIVELLIALLRPLGDYNEIMDVKREENKDVVLPEMPTICDYMTIGFNSTNAIVEDYSYDKFWNDKNEGGVPRIVAIFVCRSDIISPLVTAHFPLLCAGASLKGPSVKLIQLPKGSMAKISKAVGRPRIGVLGLKENCPGTKGLNEIISRVDNVSVPWLTSHTLQKPVIKRLKTTAPIVSKK